MNKSKNPEIEVLRAVAVLFVIFHHRAQLSFDYELLPSFLAQSLSFWSGVDLFFVISGFVITRSLCDLLLPSSGDRARILKRYAIKRGFRLLPAAWLWLLVPVLISFFARSGQGYPSPAMVINDAIAGVINVANFYYPYCISKGLVNTLCGSPQVVGPYWSLSLEEQFYLVLPILLLLFRRGALVVLFSMVILLSFCSLRMVFSYGWFNRIDGLAWGVLLALLANKQFYSVPASWLPASRFLRSSLVIGLIVSLAWFTSYKPLPTLSVGLLALVSASLVYLASLDKGFILGDGVFRRGLVMIGARSYALYLVHTPLLIVSKILTSPLALHGGMQFAVAAGVSIAMIILAAELTFRFVEVPARNYGVSLASRYAGTAGRVVAA
jgi:peptidoglycan/LPS O-acetylase OafA/YrhL